jgi:hypothetical protein
MAKSSVEVRYKLESRVSVEVRDKLESRVSVEGVIDSQLCRSDRSPR